MKMKVRTEAEGGVEVEAVDRIELDVEAVQAKTMANMEATNEAEVKVVARLELYVEDRGQHQGAVQVMIVVKTEDGDEVGVELVAGIKFETLDYQDQHQGAVPARTLAKMETRDKAEVKVETRIELEVVDQDQL
jgi:hypothetical protein